MRTVSTDHLTDQELLRLVEGLAFGEGMPIEVQQALVRRFEHLYVRFNNQ